MLTSYVPFWLEHKADTLFQADRPSQADTADTLAEEAEEAEEPELPGRGQGQLHPLLPAENSHSRPTLYR